MVSFAEIGLPERNTAGYYTEAIVLERCGQVAVRNGNRGVLSWPSSLPVGEHEVVGDGRWVVIKITRLASRIELRFAYRSPEEGGKKTRPDALHSAVFEQVDGEWRSVSEVLVKEAKNGMFSVQQKRAVH